MTDNNTVLAAKEQLSENKHQLFYALDALRKVALPDEGKQAEIQRMREAIMGLCEWIDSRWNADAYTAPNHLLDLENYLQSLSDRYPIGTLTQRAATGQSISP